VEWVKVPSYQAKQELGLSYNQKFGYGAVGGCGYILHPSFSLLLGLVLRERIKSKK